MLSVWLQLAEVSLVSVWGRRSSYQSNAVWLWMLLLQTQSIELFQLVGIQGTQHYERERR